MKNPKFIAFSILAAGLALLLMVVVNQGIGQQQQSDSSSRRAATTKQAAQTVSNLPDLSVDTGNAGSDIQEMIKILNLAAPDAGRLGVTKETFAALRAGNDVSADELGGVADKLKKMLA